MLNTESKGQGSILVAIACWLSLIPALAIGADSPASWIQLGQQLKASSSTFADVDVSRHALSPSLAIGSPTPYLTWVELNTHGISQVHVKYWEQDTWAPLGKAINLNRGHQAFEPVIVMAGSGPYVAWIELNKMGIPQLHVKRWVQGNWKLEGESLNEDPTKAAVNPSMTVGLGRPHLAWTERNMKRVYQVHVKILNKNGGVKLGNSLNVDSAKDALNPSIVMVGSTPYVAWCENASQGRFQVYVKRWTGETWARVGDSLNINPSAHALSPSIASNGSAPYMAWVEFNETGIAQVYAKHWVNGTWVQDGGSLNMDSSHHALSPSLAFKEDIPYVTWAESDSKRITQIHVKHWTGSDWAFDEESLNLDASRPASAPTLAVLRGRPYAAWKENGEDGLFRIVVKTRK